MTDGPQRFPVPTDHAGFIDAWGYVGVAVAGVGAAALIERYDYTVTFVTFGFAAILGALLTCLIWKVGPEVGTTSQGSTQQ